MADARIFILGAILLAAMLTETNAFGEEEKSIPLRRALPAWRLGARFGTAQGGAAHVPEQQQRPMAGFWSGINRPRFMNEYRMPMVECEQRAMSVFASTPVRTGIEPYNRDNASVDYLAELVKEKSNLDQMPHLFRYSGSLIDKEIERMRAQLFDQPPELLPEEVPDFNGELPKPEGPVTRMRQKIYIPVHRFPEVASERVHVNLDLQYNFVGRLLGPRGMTAKQLERDTGCRLMVRGRGSLRDPIKEETCRGRPHWEHLSDELHVLLECDDTRIRAILKLHRAVDQVQRLLVPLSDGPDHLKRRQLHELSILNGAFRTCSPVRSNRRREHNYRQQQQQLVGTNSKPVIPALSLPTSAVISLPSNSSAIATANNPYIQLYSPDPISQQQHHHLNLIPPRSPPGQPPNFYIQVSPTQDAATF